MFLDTTPNTSGYMIAGYAVAFGVMAIYLVSMIVRFRNLNQDRELLEAMGHESKPKVGKEAKKSAALKPKTKAKTSVKKKK